MTKNTPLTVYEFPQLEQLRSVAYDRKDDELLGFVETLAYTLERGTLVLPVTATFPDRPDIVVNTTYTKIAIEVRRVGWKRQSQVLAAAEPGCVVEVTKDLCDKDDARRDKKAKRGERSGDYRTIKRRGERLTSGGWVGDIPLLHSIDALREAVKDKRKKLLNYRKASDRVWIFLINDTYPGAFDRILKREDLIREVEQICTRTGFERILLFSFSSGLHELPTS